MKQTTVKSQANFNATNSTTLMCIQCATSFVEYTE